MWGVFDFKLALQFDIRIKPTLFPSRYVRCATEFIEAYSNSIDGREIVLAVKKIVAKNIFLIEKSESLGTFIMANNCPRFLSQFFSV